MDALGDGRLGLHRLEAAEDVGALRRMVRELALELGASAADTGRAELATTELGTNTLRYARPAGYMLLQRLAPPSGRGLEILAVDSGPGINNLAAVLEGRPEARPFNAAESADSLGCGLASVRRLASDFDAYTAAGRGTVVLARFLFERRERASSLRWGGVSVPHQGELANGDAWVVHGHRTGCSVLLADGLGHGPLAAQAAEAAVNAFTRDPDLALESYLLEAHQALRSTRGAAVSVARVLADEQRLLFAGVGNVEGRVHGPTGSAGLGPRNGTLGMNVQPPKLEMRERAWGRGSTLVMHSDGIRSHFALDEFPDLWRHDPTLIAAVLHRDLTRGRDDATVVVVQDTRAAQP